MVSNQIAMPESGSSSVSSVVATITFKLLSDAINGSNTAVNALLNKQSMENALLLRPQKWNGSLAEERSSLRTYAILGKATPVSSNSSLPSIRGKGNQN